MKQIQSAHLHHHHDSMGVMFRGACGDFRNELKQVTLQLVFAFVDEFNHTFDYAHMTFVHNSGHRHCAGIVANEGSETQEGR
jgi:hypothetical protein